MKNVVLKNNNTGRQFKMKFADKGVLHYLSGEMKVVELLVGSRVMSYLGFEGCITEIQKSSCVVKMNDGSTLEVKKTSIARGHFHPNGMRKVRTDERRRGVIGFTGIYRGFVLRGVHHKNDGDFKEVYYNCYKEGSDELQILRPCDIDDLYK